MNSEILKINSAIKNNEKNLKNYHLQTFKDLDKHKNLNANLFTINNYKYAKKNNDSLLNNICYSVKDNINIVDTITTGGSLFFKDYVSPFSASVIEKLNSYGAIPVSKSNLDEFGLGGTGLFSAFGNVLNPFDNSRITGGSSSGSAVHVATKVVPFSLGTDTGDSIRLPASYNGVCGFKPTYGVVSRYGVFPYSPSLDHVGVFANSINDIAIVMDAISGYDENDFTSQDVKFNFFKNINNIDQEWKIGYFENIVNYLEDKYKKLFLDSIKKISKFFYQISKYKFPISLMKLVPTVYEILSYSEAVSCYQNITGVNFGLKGEGKNFFEKAVDTRTKNFGLELKRRFVLGAYCTLSQNYEDIFLKCKKIRRLIVEKSNEIFKKCDFIIMPGSSCVAPKIDDVLNKKLKQNYNDTYLQIANFGGYPSITIPMGYVDNMPIGINITGNINQDEKVLAFSLKIKKLLHGD